MIKDLIEVLSDARNEKNAIAMSAYMKNKFCFFGVKSPERKLLFKEFFLEIKHWSQADSHLLVENCWKEEERELHYFAMEALFRSRTKWNTKSLSVMEAQICGHSWWDTVDFIASNSIGFYFKDHPSLMQKKTRAWNQSDNIWLIRTSLIFQLKYKERQDPVLLEEYILRHRKSKEFFIQKAAGWALRQYSKYDLNWVVDFVEQNDLPSLSSREALKYLR